MPRSSLPSDRSGPDLDAHDPVGYHPAEADPRAVAALDGLRPGQPPAPGERVAAMVGRLLARSGRPPSHLAGLVVAVAVLAGAGWWLLRPPAAPIESSLPLASAEPAGASPTDPTATAAGSGAPASSTTTTLDAQLVVQAAGAVVRGGVYRLPAGARVDDLVRAAGGLAPDADRDRVNLAAPLADGERVWVPRAGQVEVPEVVAGAGAGGGVGGGAAGSPGSSAGSASGPPAVVDLNAATAEQLDTLPGVGPATAAAILAYREEHGRFSSVDELLEVRGIGDAKLEQLRASVTV